MPNDLQSGIPLSQFLTYRLYNLSQTAGRATARWHQKVSGLTVAEWRVVATLGFFGTATPSEISDKTFMDKAVVSRVKTALTSKGLISDQSDEADSRKRLLTLTEEGRAVYLSTMPAAQERQAAMMKVLSEEEMMSLSQSLDKLQHYFEQRLSD